MSATHLDSAQCQESAKKEASQAKEEDGKSTDIRDSLVCAAQSSSRQACSRSENMELKCPKIKPHEGSGEDSSNTEEKQFATIGQATVYGLGSGVGWFIAVVLIAAIRERIRYANIPGPLRGVGMAFLITGLMGLAFLGFMGFEI